MSGFRCGWRRYGCKRTFRSELRRMLHEIFGCRYIE